MADAPAPMSTPPSTVLDLPRPSQLWKRLSAERKLHAAEGFWADDHANAEQGEAIGAIAQRLKFRIKSVLALPRAKKAKYLLALPALPEIIAARLLVAYHLGQQRPMMAAFLDGVGIAHEGGLIADEDVQAPEPGRLASAAKTLAVTYPADDVAVYLTTLVWQDPDTWRPLADVPEIRLPD